MNLRIPIRRLDRFPTPVAGLALGIGSIGSILDATLEANGIIQSVTAVISGILLLILVARFVCFPSTLVRDLRHPVVGSVAPTFAMASMVVSSAVILHHHEDLGHAIWLMAVVVHILFLTTFIFHRAVNFKWEEMVPSWFVPPVGIIVAPLTYHGDSSGFLYQVAVLCLYFGLTCYLIMLPLMFYRFIFKDTIQDAAKPTIAILAAPASLSMAGYLSIIEEPSSLAILILFGIAVLMTCIVYMAFFKLLRLPFSPGYAAFTFPMAIGATALYKAAAQLEAWGVKEEVVSEVLLLAHIELVLATLVITGVTIRFIEYFLKSVPVKA